MAAAAALHPALLASPSPAAGDSPAPGASPLSPPSSASTVAMSPLGERPPPPLVVADGGLRWVRTEICKGADLVDGSAWIEEYKKRLTKAQSEEVGGAGAAAPPRAGRRLLRQVATDGDDPRFWGNGGGGADAAPVGLRNQVLRDMQPERLFGPNADHTRGAGRKVRLATGEEVIFWFNVGSKPDTPMRERVSVTAARCPHQGMCLNSGELKDIEDVAGRRKGIVRCPAHSKLFDVRTGEGMGNTEVLKTYQCRFEHGHWYVAVGPASDALQQQQQLQQLQQQQQQLQQQHEEAGDVDMTEAQEPLPKRPRTDEELAVEQAAALAAAVAPPSVVRQLAYHGSLC